MPEQDELTIVVFRVAEQSFGLPVTDVGQILEMVMPAYLPQLPPFVPGIIDYHGTLVPLIDMRRRFNLTFRPYDLHTPLILTQHNGRFLALIVDAVVDVVTLSQVSVQPITAILPTELAQLTHLPIPEMYLAGVAHLPDALLPVLAADRLLTRPEAAQVQTALVAGEGV